MNDDNLVEAWERGTPVEADRSRRGPTSVLSVRVPDSLLAALSERARQEDKPTGTLARELLESVLAAKTLTTPPDLVDMFSRWVGEAFGSVATSVEITHAPAALSSWLWVSTSGFLRENVAFSQSVPRISFRHPVYSSREVEPATDSAGDEAA